MPFFLNKGRFIIAILLAMLLLLMSSCKKLAIAAGSRSQLESLFEENVLNKNFVVRLATDNGTDITSQFAGYNFVLTKTTSFYDGPMTGTKAGVTYSGTWTSNDDYSKLIINLNTPTPPAEFGFINRSWKFTKKAVPVLELAPWGSTDPKVLHMERL
jgi:hypothetical protein